MTNPAEEFADSLEATSEIEAMQSRICEALAIATSVQMENWMCATDRNYCKNTEAQRETLVNGLKELEAQVNALIATLDSCG